MDKQTEELIKGLRRDIWDIRSMAKGKYMFPYDMCCEILIITKQSLANIKEAMKQKVSIDK